MESLLDSCWPKDPLRESEQISSGHQMIELGNFFDAVSREHQEGDIKSSLNKIKQTELKLSDMISRHIKNKGIEKFQNSTFVVTNRSSLKQSLEKAQADHNASRGKSATRRLG